MKKSCELHVARFITSKPEKDMYDKKIFCRNKKQCCKADGI
jgi:hypothetical protein